jgi:hypothetical protein
MDRPMTTLLIGTYANGYRTAPQQHETLRGPYIQNSPVRIGTYATTKR